MRRSKRKTGISSYIIGHIKNNINEYIVLIGLLIIGCLLGVVMVNNMNSMQKENISQYINEYAGDIKDSNIDYIQILKNECKDNFIICLILWLSGTIIIGIPIIYIFILFRGLCLRLHNVCNNRNIWST